MPAALSYAVRPPLAVVEYQFQPGFPEWSQTMDALLHEPTFQPGFSVLLDRSQVNHAAGTSYVKRIVEFMDRRRETGLIDRWACVVGDLTSYGMGRIDPEQLSEFEGFYRTFRDRPSAEQWLLTPATVTIRRPALG